MKRILLTAAASAAIVTGGIAAAAPAMAAPAPAGTVTAHTHENGVADTTSVSGPNTIASPGGPVWAYDNLERTITAVPNGDGTWNVTVASTGSYAAFADPRTGQAYTGSGPVKGWVSYVIQSDTAPSAANLGAQSPTTLRSADLALALFGGHGSIVPGSPSHYSFNYKLAGQDYPQVG
jgi:hypothetical protein